MPTFEHVATITRRVCVFKMAVSFSESSVYRDPEWKRGLLRRCSFYLQLWDMLCCKLSLVIAVNKDWVWRLFTNWDVQPASVLPRLFLYVGESWQTVSCEEFCLLCPPSHACLCPSFSTPPYLSCRYGGNCGWDWWMVVCLEWMFK